MVKFILSLILSLCLFSGAAQAQENRIESKKAFGTYQYFQKNGVRLNNNQLANMVKKNPEAADLMAKAKTNNTVGSIFGFIGGGLVGWQLGAAIGGGEANWAAAGIGAGLIGISIPFNAGYNKNSQKAVELYNAGLATGSYYFKPEFKVCVTGNGLGLLMKF